MNSNTQMGPKCYQWKKREEEEEKQEEDGDEYFSSKSQDKRG